MYTVYVLKDANGKLYKGYTGNLNRRLKDHTNGHTQTTSRMRLPLTVEYIEEFEDLESARKRELYFKSAAGRRFLKIITPP